jgi:SAM-dependent methyltransferase
MEADRLRADYIERFQPHCDRYLSQLADPRGRSVLVVGCGQGTEMLWAIRHGAAEVIGIDVVERTPDALELALADRGIASPPPYRMLHLGVEDVTELGRTFDLVVSNNVFEHLPDVPGAFRALLPLIEPGEGRIAIFTDPLLNSSHGSHMAIGPWEHLHVPAPELEARAESEHAWRQYETLNGMTLIDFLQAVRDSGYVILQLFVVPDRAMDELQERLPVLPRDVSVTDLALEGIGIELMRLDRPPS